MAKKRKLSKRSLGQLAAIASLRRINSGHPILRAKHWHRLSNNRQANDRSVPVAAAT